LKEVVMDKKNSFVALSLIGVAVIGMFGCTRERPSEIVRIVEKAGAGNLRTASVHSITTWFDKHQSVALRANQLCNPASASAEAVWPETTEGRVCNAAGEVAGFLEFRPKLELNKDHKTFQGGSR
jgi:hypothetical protein